MTNFKIGIIGAGWIAGKMAMTLNQMEGVEAYAIASRSLDKAQAFANEWGIKKAYGSYEELVDDKEVDMVYIATPHSHHCQHALMCIEKGKPVLCEKAFTMNAKQAAEVLAKSKEKNVFVAEAIWTRYMPISLQLIDLVKNGAIGNPTMITANLGYPMVGKERLMKPELAGGALLDVGIYPLNFAAMIFGDKIEKTISTCTKLDTGVDAQACITQIFADGKMATLNTSMLAHTDRMGVISGDGGCIIVDNINNPQHLTIEDKDFKIVAEYDAPKQISGYEYQVTAAIEAIRAGKIETPFMPHSETLRMMEMMDALRKEWGIKYPGE
ncbi:MAG: Gfo/Idh/MocA family oxidoreductase [Paludibacteraceae bacterium]|nr:Gfo/Idh/MocA family oxidoreductase [Paludibacteraceae bacterium]